MNKINSVARSMMEDGGSVSYIVELLEDPEDAKLNLKPELEEVKKTAVDCRKECEDVKKKFEYWQRVIIHLSRTALDLRGKLDIPHFKLGMFRIAYSNSSRREDCDGGKGQRPEGCGV